MITRVINHNGFQFPIDPNKIFLDTFDSDAVLIERVKVKVERVLFNASKESKYDLALISVEKPLKHFVSLDLKRPKLEIGDPLYLIGAAMGDVPYTIKHGELTAYKGRYVPNHWFISIPAIHGQSGGGVFNAETNKMIGIICRSYGSTSLLMPLSRIEELLADDWGET